MRGLTLFCLFGCVLTAAAEIPISACPGCFAALEGYNEPSFNSSEVLTENTPNITSTPETKVDKNEGGDETLGGKPTDVASSQPGNWR